jgi:chitinase
MDAETAKTGKKYMITGAPQCTLNPGDHNMDAMIYNAKFDALFVQFYNQGPASCTARSRANGVGGFNFDAWASYLNRAGSASAGAKIYIGLLGGPTGSAFAPGDYLNTPEVQNLIATYGKKSQLGGVMLWDATAAQVNVDNTLPANKKYWDVVKDALLVGHSFL